MGKPREPKKVSGGASTVTDELNAQWPLLESNDVAARKGKIAARAAYKASALVANAAATVPVLVEPGLTVLVSNISVDGRGRLVCTVTHNSIPAGANPFIFVNPPISVPTGTTVDGRGDEVTIFSEDLTEAFKQMVRDAVRTVL